MFDGAHTYIYLQTYGQIEEEKKFKSIPFEYYVDWTELLLLLLYFFFFFLDFFFFALHLLCI